MCVCVKMKMCVGVCEDVCAGVRQCGCVGAGVRCVWMCRCVHTSMRGNIKKTTHTPA